MTPKHAQTPPGGLEHRIGQVLDRRYRIWRVIGEGAFGHVYEAVDEQSKKPVAVKVLPPAIADDPEWLERLRREAKAATRIGNPHIVAASDLGRTDDGTAYLVLELVDGPTLEEVLLRHKRIPLGRAASIGAQIADALSAAHASGIVHRDLKPSNIVLERRATGEFVRIVDFGIVKFIREGSDGPDLTTPGVFLGTPEYMSPEQAAGGRLDGRADIFSLGVVLYEMISGELPHTGPGPVEILMAKTGEQHRPLREVARKVPPAVDRLVGRMLSYEPPRRPKTMQEVADALRPFADAVNIGATGPRPAARPRPTHRGRGYAWLWIAGALAVAAALYVRLFGFALPVASPTADSPDGRLEAAREAVADRPDDPGAFVALGDAFLAAARPDDAARAYRTALRLDPANLGAREGLRRATASPPPPAPRR